MEVSKINGYDIKDKKAVRTYDTVASMKIDGTVKLGQHVKTRGYYEINDGGSAEYYITDTESLTDYQEELNSGLYANLLIQDKINVKQIGAKGDNETDDTTVLRKMFDVCRAKNITSIYFPKGRYIVSDTLLDYGIDGLVLLGENDDIYNSTIITRAADVTIFNFGGVMELTGLSYHARDLLMKNITVRDKEGTYTENVFATLHYTMRFTIENCSISCRNKALDLRQCYDGRFINTDFSAGGNSNDPLIALHGGKHASPTEIGWDSANCISFIACRFERYYGTAIKTINEEQPDTYNSEYDPVIGLNPNVIIIDNCRFEAPTLLSGYHLDFNYTGNLQLNCSITCLDGQQSLIPVKFSRCTRVYGNLLIGYNTQTGVERSNFESPLIVIDNNSSKFNMNLIVGTVYSNYQLDYFIDITAGDSTRRTMNINLIYDGKDKKLYSMNSSNLLLNTFKQGKIATYGSLENGIKIYNDPSIYNSYDNYMSYDSTTQTHRLHKRYFNTSNTSNTYEAIISNDNFTYKTISGGLVANGGLMIQTNKPPLSHIAGYRSNGSSSRYIGYSDSYPSSEVTNVLYKKGDIIFNTSPSAGGNVGWVCVTAGNPGTWKSFGTIES